MNRLILQDAMDVIADSVNLCTGDARLRSLINRAEERLMSEGDWVGTFQVLRVCMNEGLLTWPRPVERITLMDVCDWSVTMRNQWYEFLENGPGYQTETNGCAFGCSGGCSGMQGIDRGTSCLYSDICPTPLKIKVYPDVTEDSGVTITFRGYDENMNWIQTENTPVSGIWIEGEEFDLSLGAAVSTKKYFPPGPLAVIKSISKGPVRVYSYDDSLSPPVQRLIAVYEPGETRPVYRRTFVPGLKRTADDGSCVSSTVTALVKLRHIDAISGLDSLVLQSVEALRLGCQAIRKEEMNLITEANEYWYGRIDAVSRSRQGGAVQVLQKQLENYHGPGIVSPIRYESRAIAGAGVLNIQ